MQPHFLSLSLSLILYLYLYLAPNSIRLPIGYAIKFGAFAIAFAIMQNRMHYINYRLFPYFTVNVTR